MALTHAPGFNAQVEDLHPTSNEARLRALTEFEYWWCGAETRHSNEPAGLEPLITRHELATCLLDLRVCTRLKKLGVDKCRVTKAPADHLTDSDIEDTTPLQAAKSELLSWYKQIWAEHNPEREEQSGEAPGGEGSDDDDGFGALQPTGRVSREDRAAAEFEEKFTNWRKLSQQMVHAMREAGSLYEDVAPATGTADGIEDIADDLPGVQASVTREERLLWREMKHDIGPWMRQADANFEMYGHIPALARRVLGRNNSASRCERDFASAKFFCGPLSSNVDPWHVRDRTRLRMNKGTILWLDQKKAMAPLQPSAGLG